MYNYNALVIRIIVVSRLVESASIKVGPSHS